MRFVTPVIQRTVHTTYKMNDYRTLPKFLQRWIEYDNMVCYLAKKPATSFVPTEKNMWPSLTGKSKQ